MNPIGVYFSPETRNRFASDFLASYRGILILLMQQHLAFQIVTPRTLAKFAGPTLILPDVRVLSTPEKNEVKDFVAAGKRLVVTGADETEIPASDHVVRLPQCPGKAYEASLENDFEQSSPSSQKPFLDLLNSDDSVKVTASSKMATSISENPEGVSSVYFANFAGLRAGSNPIQDPQRDVEVKIKDAQDGSAVFLPFMGEDQPLMGKRDGDALVFRVPLITRGGVFEYRHKQ